MLLSQTIERASENKLVMDNNSDLGDEQLPHLSQLPLNHFSSAVVRSSQDPIATSSASEKSYLGMYEALFFVQYSFFYLNIISSTCW